jgi:plasmid stabilization system protein ParE
MTYSVIFSAPAEADLFAIYDYIAERAGGAIAQRFVESIEAYYLGFAHMPERGTKRDDLRLGLRTVGFRRRRQSEMVIKRGREWALTLRPPRPFSNARHCMRYHSPQE